MLWRLRASNILKQIKRGIALDYQPVEDIIIFADRCKVSRVISNVLDNAIEFTTEGSITITTATTVTEGTKTDNNNNNVVNSNVVTVCVRDSGIGIDAAVFPKLFTKFAFTSAFK